MSRGDAVRRPFAHKIFISKSKLGGRVVNA